MQKTADSSEGAQHAVIDNYMFTGAIQQLGLSVTPGSSASVVATAKGSAPIHQVMRPKQVQLRPTVQVCVQLQLFHQVIYLFV